MEKNKYVLASDAREILELALEDDWKIDYAFDRLDELLAADVSEVVKYRDCMRKFRECQNKLWSILQNTDMSYGCKPYEGEIEVKFDFPNYFESPDKPPISSGCEITLNCYVLGSGRHHEFRGKNFEEAVKNFGEWFNEFN